MATIYDKPGADRCLILDVREALIYPFNHGDWSEIRIGMSVSSTTATENNATPAAEQLILNNANQGFYMGIKDNSPYLPLTSNCTGFVGVTSYGVINDSTTIFNNIGGEIYNNTVSDLVYTCATGTLSYMPGPTALRGRLSDSTATIGSGDYSALMGMRFILQNRGLTGQRLLFNFYHDSQLSNGVSPANVRRRNAAMGNTISSTQSLYLTTGFTSGGGPLPVPTCFYFYLPLFTVRARIHTLVIDRYA